MIHRKKYILSLLILALLLSIFPPIATAAEADCAFTEKKNEATLTLVLAEEDAVNTAIAPLQSVRTDRIRNVFPDPNLAAVIAEAFGVSQDAFVTQRDLDRVIALEADNRNIQNLQGMQYLHNLREVSFLENRISNLQPLAGLISLERLLLDDNQIEHITPLQNLTNLEWLWLDGNRITNANALSRLEQLVWLTLWDNQIEDITPLQNLTNLVALWLADNRITDISAVSNMWYLETLSMANNYVHDLRPLAHLDEMQLIWIGRQDYRFPVRLFELPFTMTNPLIAPNGTHIVPSAISHEGIYDSYDSPTFFWETLYESTRTVYFDFSERIYVGQTSDVFSGRITQPVSRAPFSDVSYLNWFYEAVAFVFTESLMSGVSSHQFAPLTSLDRAMAVTVLHRLAGSPEFDFLPVFVDVAEDAWYAPAAMWAFATGVVHGYGQEDIFNPRAAITREQFATLIHRLAEQEEDFLPPPDSFLLYQFVDHAEISDWAYEAFRWAAYEGIFTGTPQRELNPRGTTLRAECATILMRLVAREISE